MKMAIYLVDYENVYIEGLSGMEMLTEEDKLHIFYTHNRCGLTFGLYEQLIACKAEIKLNEVSVSPRNGDPVKNALDLQLMMYTGFLIGQKATDKLYIVSKDKDFLLGMDFFTHYITESGLELSLIPTIADAFREDEPEAETDEASFETAPAASPELEAESQLQKLVQEYEGQYGSFVRALREPHSSFAQFCDQYAKPTVSASETDMLTAMLMAGKSSDGTQSPLYSVQYHNTVRNLLGKNTDEETVCRVCDMISASEDLVAFNNALARFYKDGQQTKTIYHKFKPQFEALRHLSKARRKG